MQLAAREVQSGSQPCTWSLLLLLLRLQQHHLVSCHCCTLHQQHTHCRARSSW